MNNQTKITEPVFILAGTSQQYTDARRKLALSPAQAFWLTRASNLSGKQRPKVFRFGDWKSLAKIHEIEATMTAVAAEITDI